MLRPGTLQWRTLSCSESSCSTAVTMYGIIILLYFVFFFKLQELTSVKKQSPGLMSRMSDSMRNMASSWMLKNREPEFQEMAEYIKTFREKMLVLETISDKIAKDRFGKKKVWLFAFTLKCFIFWHYFRVVLHHRINLLLNFKPLTFYVVCDEENHYRPYFEPSSGRLRLLICFKTWSQVFVFVFGILKK